MIVGCQAVGVVTSKTGHVWVEANARRRGQKEAGSGMVASGRQDKDEEDEDDD